MAKKTEISSKTKSKHQQIPDNTKNNKRRETAIANIMNYHKLRKTDGLRNGRKTFAKTLEIYVKQYLNSDVSVRHFKKWADAKPGEALPWAWKVVYGDGNGTLGPQKGQVNVLIQILTGRQDISVTPVVTANNDTVPDSHGNQLPE